MLLVLKYGGTTLATPEHIQSVARHVAELYRQDHRLLIVVSAMGNTTNELIKLAHQVNPQPPLRELDMLLTTGERISASLLTMALAAENIPAVSFTGSQAGVLTSDHHVNALIREIKPTRFQQEWQQKKVIVLAGFQGVNPITKEITTLGRGGSDTSAVAMAAALQANHCEIRKEVDGIYSADPRLVPQALHLKDLSVLQLAEMTFWGAKVLHYRSAELALLNQVPLWVGSASDLKRPVTKVLPTKIPTNFDHSEEGAKMLEATKVLSVNSHIWVLRVYGLQDVFQFFQDLESCQIARPQILRMEKMNHHDQEVYLTGPTEILNSIQAYLLKKQMSYESLSAVTATCSGLLDPDLLQSLSQALQQAHIQVFSFQFSALSLTAYVSEIDHSAAVQAFHSLVEKTSHA